MQVAMQVMSVTPPPPSELNPAMPPALDAIIARAMAKDAAARYDSARSLHHDLRELKDALDGSTVRPAVTAPSTTNVRRRSVRFKTLCRRVRHCRAGGGVVRVGSAATRAARAASRGRRVVRPRHQRHSRGGVFSSEQGAGARARDRQRLPAGAGAAGGSLHGDGPHRPGAGRPAAGHGATPGSLGAVGRRVELCRRRRGDARPQLHDRDRQVRADRGLGWANRTSPRPTSILAVRTRRTRTSIAPSHRT